MNWPQLYATKPPKEYKVTRHQKPHVRVTPAMFERIKEIYKTHSRREALESVINEFGVSRATAQTHLAKARAVLFASRSSSAIEAPRHQPKPDVEKLEHEIVRLKAQVEVYKELLKDSYANQKTL